MPVLNLVKSLPWLIIAVLAIGVYHYRGAAADWQRQSIEQANRADTAESANSTLLAANASLNARNNNLVVSLNERSQQLNHEQQRADANKRAYDQAVSQSSDWGNNHVPDSVARVLRAGTRLQDDSRPSDSSPR